MEDIHGCTALHRAFSGGHGALAQWLVGVGAKACSGGGKGRGCSKCALSLKLLKRREVCWQLSCDAKPSTGTNTLTHQHTSTLTTH